MPSPEPSPRPWRVAESVCGWQNCIEDANGNDIGSCWYNRDRLRAEADAALIVDAVNFYDATVDTQLTALLAERDRLRDQLASALRLADECSRDAAAVHAGRALAVEEAQSEANRRADRLADIVRRLSRHLANYITSESENDLLREARAAIGEDAP